MTSLTVIAFKIGQSAGKVSKFGNDKNMILPHRPHGCRSIMIV